MNHLWSMAAGNRTSRREAGTPDHFIPTTANFHEPSFCFFKTRTP